MSDAETVENPVEENPIVDLINHSLNQDYNKANKVFGDILGQKLDIALEQEKIRMAGLVYNGIDPDEEDLDDEELDDEDVDDTETGDDDQLEFDLESDDIEGTEEDGAVEDSEEDGIDDQGEDDLEEDEL